jgi:hypothetical protein
MESDVGRTGRIGGTTEVCDVVSAAAVVAQALGRTTHTCLPSPPWVKRRREFCKRSEIISGRK